MGPQFTRCVWLHSQPVHGKPVALSSECICEEFVAEVEGKRRKPFLDALKSTFPVYAKLGRGRHCHADLIYGAIRAVKEGTGGLGWLVFDRANRRFGKSRPVFDGAGNIYCPMFVGG